MKKIIFLLAFQFIIGFTFAQRTVLTSAAKDSLMNNAAFKREVSWAIYNKAAYWKGLDGTSLPGGQNATTLARWAKSRALASQILNDPTSVSTTKSMTQFLYFAKNMAVYNKAVAECVTYMISQSSFDTLADNWFDNEIANVNF